jgi:flagellar motor switch protein FliM
LSDLLYLEVGDVIRLDRYKDEELDVCIGNKPRFKGTAGKKRGKKAIKITQLIKDDLEFETDIKDFAEDENEREG